MKKIFTFSAIIYLFATIQSFAWTWTEDAFKEFLKENNNQQNVNYKVYNNSLNMPEYINKEKVKPNYDTQLFYLFRYVNGFPSTKPYHKIKALDTYSFKFDLTKEKYVESQLKKTSLLSYIVYDDGKIKVDEINPKFDIIFNNETKYISNSVGKSIVSYITGHAVCKGYIKNINEKMNDWPILKNTLYYDQRLIDLLNMNAGDYHLFTKDQRFKNSKNFSSEANITDTVRTDLINTKKQKSKYYYNNFLTNVVHNYVVFKSKENYEDLLNEVFNTKAKIENDVYLFEKNTDNNWPLDIQNYNNKSYTFFITRYDYLRIAIAMLEDWNNNTCEGQYLKSLFENRIKKNISYKDKTDAHTNTKSYGGFFHMDLSNTKDRHIFVMDGYGGQTITIDFDNNKIISTLAIHRDYNWMKLVHKKL